VHYRYTGEQMSAQDKSGIVTPVEQSEYVLEFNRRLTIIQALSIEYDALWAKVRATTEKEIDARSIPAVVYGIQTERVSGIPHEIFTLYAQLKSARIDLSTYIEQHAPVS